jgi:hypothetical protein
MILVPLVVTFQLKAKGRPVDPIRLAFVCLFLLDRFVSHLNRRATFPEEGEWIDVSHPGHDIDSDSRRTRVASGKMYRMATVEVLLIEGGHRDPPGTNRLERVPQAIEVIR